MAILKPEKTTVMNGVTVNQYLLKSMYPSGGMDRICGVTIHNTDWITTAAETTPAEQYTRATLNGNMNDVIVHYYVDDKCAWQNLPHNVHGWHAADGQGDGNMQTIAIECIMDGSGSERSKKSEDNAARLAAVILNELGFGIERLYTHQHWYGKKYCPAYILPHWDSFKSKVIEYINKYKGGSTPSDKPAEEKQMYRVRLSWDNPKSQTGAYSVLDNAKKNCKEGYTVFDKDGKAVYKNEGNAAPEKPSTATPEITYISYTNGSWRSEIKNYNDTNGSGYSGVEGYPINGFAAKTNVGKLSYRVHITSGGWLDWVDAYDINDWNNGCAGYPRFKVDGIQFKLENCDYEVKYRVSTTSSTSYLDWVKGYNLINDDGYAGIFGKPIDKVQACIVKK